MTDKIKLPKQILILASLSYLFFMLGNGIVNLTNPDEVFYAQTAKEMAQHKTWLVPYLFGQPQFEKPVLLYWLLRIGYSMFGISNFGARFFPAFFGALGVIAVYFLALGAYKDKKKAFISALILLSSGLYVGLARTVFTDLVFSVLILLSLASFFWGYTNSDKKTPGIFLFSIFSALAVLTKGPLGFLIPITTILLFLSIRKDLKFLICRHSLWAFLIFTAIAAPWYLFMIKKFGNAFIYEFFYNDHIRRLFEAEHRANDKWFFYPLSMIFGMFPWSVFAFSSFYYLLKRLREKGSQPVYLFLLCWILAVFITFQPAHSKLVSYIFPLFPALAVITGDFICSRINSEKKDFSIFLRLAWLLLLAIPAAFIIASMKYPQYAPSKVITSVFFIVYTAMLAIMFYTIAKKKFLAFVYLSALQIPVLLLFIMLSHSRFEPYVSSKSACEYLLNNYSVDNRILCSKAFLRGVKFFTDKDVVVINIGGSGYFSPHPVPFFNSDEKVSAFLRSQPVTYCVLNKSSLSDLHRIADFRGFKIVVLNVIGDEYIVLARSI